MKKTKPIMGMPITVEVLDKDLAEESIDLVFKYFRFVDRKFSVYKTDSEISKINKGKLIMGEYSREMLEVLNLSDITKKESFGYFNVNRNGHIDPSGLVKGWAIHNAAKLLLKKGCKNFYIDAGGDIEMYGKNSKGKKWKVGIKNPLNQEEIVKVLGLSGGGIATSGDYIRGQHIYNPKGEFENNIISLTVVGPNAYEADRFATAAFAMGDKGINFIEQREGLEGYMIDKNGIATMTSNFYRFLADD